MASLGRPRVSHGEPKREVEMLVSTLNELKITEVHAKLLRALENILLLICKGKDVTPLMSQVIQMLPKHDLLVKRICSLFLCRYKFQVPDLSFLVVNTLTKDCADPNPLVRSLALRTFCSVQPLAEFSEAVMAQGLQDTSSTVRRTAVLSCARVSKTSPGVVFERGLVDDLYSMLRDPDPLVVANSLTSLEEILGDEGGVVINRNIAQYLLGRLDTFTEWNLIHIFHFLHKYRPTEEKDVTEFMDSIEPYLLHSSVALAAATTKLYLSLTTPEDVKSDVLSSIKTHFASSLSSTNHEMDFLLLDFISELLNSWPGLFSSQYKSFFCHYSEPLNIKLKKLALFPKLVSSENVSAILKELEMYSTDVSARVSGAAIVAFVLLGEKLPSVQSMCLLHLLQLLDFDHEPVNTQVLVELQNANIIDSVKPQLQEKLLLCSRRSLSTAGRSALLCLLTDHCSDVGLCRQVLGDIIKTWEEAVVALKHTALVTTIKLFFRHPAHFQVPLGQIVELCCTDNDLSLQDRALFYYGILQIDTQLAKCIVTEKPDCDRPYRL